MDWVNITRLITLSPLALTHSIHSPNGTIYSYSSEFLSSNLVPLRSTYIFVLIRDFLGNFLDNSGQIGKGFIINHYYCDLDAMAAIFRFVIVFGTCSKI